MKEITKELIESLDKNELLNFCLVSLISADTLLTAKDCENAIEHINKFKKLIPQTSFSDEKKENYLKFCEDCLEICERDKKIFEGNYDDEEEVQS